VVVVCVTAAEKRGEVGGVDATTTFEGIAWAGFCFGSEAGFACIHAGREVEELLPPANALDMLDNTLLDVGLLAELDVCGDLAVA
jgi:hypothetical protein